MELNASITPILSAGAKLRTQGGREEEEGPVQEAHYQHSGGNTTSHH